MTDFHIQLPQFFTLALANFFMGWLWYSPVAPWFKAWVKAAGLPSDPSKMSKEAKKAMPLLFGGAIFSSFALSFALQFFVRSLHAETFGVGAVIGVMLWLGMVLPVLLGTLWEGRKGVLVRINLGNYLVVNAVFGGVLAIWR